MTVTEIGSPRRRKEDQRLITGRTRYTDNIVLPGIAQPLKCRSLSFSSSSITAVSRSTIAEVVS